MPAQKQGAAADTAWGIMEQMPIERLSPAPEMVLAAARLKAQHRVADADAFALALAFSHKAKLWTGDPELRELRTVVEIEWLG